MSNYFVYYSDEAKNDLRNIFMHIAYELGSRDNAESQVNPSASSSISKQASIFLFAIAFPLPYP